MAIIPAPKVAIAFNGSITTDPSTWVWTDVTAAFRDDPGITIERGRKQDLGQIEAGNVTVPLDNRTGRFDPTNATSPYAPNVVPGKPLRIQAVLAGVTYDLFTGFVEVWDPGFDGLDSVVTVTAVDALGNFSRADSTYPQPVLIDYQANRAGQYLIPGVQLPAVVRQGGDFVITCPAQPDRPTGYHINVYGEQPYGPVTVATGAAQGSLYASVYPSINWRWPFTDWTRIDAIQLIDLDLGTRGVPDNPFAFRLMFTGNRAPGVQVVPATPIASILDAIAWPSSRRRLDALTAPVQEYFTTATPLDVLQQLADSDGGTFFISRDGYATYHSRDHRHLNTATIQATLGYQITDIPYKDAQPTADLQRVVNSVRIPQQGSTATGSTVTAADTVSQAAYGTRAYTPPSASLLANASDVAQVAVDILKTRNVPRLAIDTIALLPIAVQVTAWTLNDATFSQLNLSTILALGRSWWDIVLSTEINDAFSVRIFTPYSNTAVQASAVDGITYRIKRNDWSIYWRLAPLTPDDTSTWRLGDGAASRLGSTTRLT